jgi:hypothetical protein
MLESLSIQSLSLEQKIVYLEDLYAECLKDEMDTITLTKIWQEIQKLTLQNKCSN